MVDVAVVDVVPENQRRSFAFRFGPELLHDFAHPLRRFRRADEVPPFQGRVERRREKRIVHFDADLLRDGLVVRGGVRGVRRVGQIGNQCE